MSKPKFKGVATHILPAQKGEGKKGPWAKRTFVVEEQGVEYPQKAVFNLFKNGEYTDMAGDKFPLSVGDEVEVEYLIKANEYKGKWYGDLSVWSFNVLSKGSGGSASNDAPPF